MRAPSILLTLVLLPTQPMLATVLNDTGQDLCVDGGSLANCTDNNTGNAATHPRQDARFGADAAATAGQLTKIGGGAVGFDFTPLDASGVEIALTTDTLPPIPSATPACIRDNRTGLIWEVKTDDGKLRDKGWTYRWGAGTGGTLCFDGTGCNTDNYVLKVNALDLCGESMDDWRLPSRRELLSIIDHGASLPAIDANYFRNTAFAVSVSNNPIGYWSSDLWKSAPNSYAWFVYFKDGNSTAVLRTNNNYVRLVRGGQ
jgi:hypothetical protein